MTNKKVALIGNSSILSKLIAKSLIDYSVFTFGRNEIESDIVFNAIDIETSTIKKVFKDFYDVYIFNIGVLIPKNIVEQNADEIYNSLSINAIFIIKSCEYILSNNKNARIFIVGSESGRKGSFDTTYFLAKSMLRAYVRQRMLKSPDQQLLLLSPSTIEDSKMTQERTDVERVNQYRQLHPKGRFLFCDEVVLYLSDIIKNPSTYLSNTEIEINGGKFSRML